jgi:hypothetical protein
MAQPYPLLTLLGSLALSAQLSAATLNEDVVGDLSGNRLAPTPLTLDAGSNLVSGHYGRAIGGGVDLDYLHIILPAGHALVALQVLPGTTHGGGRSFIGVQAGTQLTVAPNAAQPSDLLGYGHFTAVSSPLDILADMGNRFGEGFGSQGFVAPLRGTDYTFWIMETQANVAFDYRFNFEVSAVPLPASSVTLGAALASLMLLRRRHGRS